MRQFIPVFWSGLKLTPDGFNVLQAGHTQHLDQLDELQRSILMDLSHIVCNQMVQNLHNLKKCTEIVRHLKICLENGVIQEIVCNVKMSPEPEHR